MELLVAGLVGVVVGAAVATAIALAILERRVDRDLIERRIRALREYLDCLGDLERAVWSGADDPRVLEQAWANAKAFSREFRLTGWVLPEPARGALAAIVDELQRFERSRGEDGAGGGGRGAQVLCELYHQVRRVVDGELAREERAFRDFRFLPRFGARR